MKSDFTKIIANDLYANGYRAWGMYEDFIYPKIKEEIEKRYDCKLSDSDYDEVVDKLALLYFEQFIAVDKIGDLQIT